MTEDDRATIFALASGVGRAGVAVLRLSGPRAFAAAAQLTGGAPPPRRAVLRSLHDPASGEELDRALVLAFASPASFTGEDVVELHLHGGRAVVEGVVAVLARLEGLRPAEAGEFTRRAFEAGKLDLSAAEGLHDLVMADTAAQRRLALRQSGGDFAALVEGWRVRLLDLLAPIEAFIDFPDEDLPPDMLAGTAEGIAALAREIGARLADGGRGERLRAGVMVVILGPPNIGKSSLLNALAGRDAAIVSARAGTTRDIIEVALELDGYPVTLVDTAGIREAGDEIEAEGVRRALARAGEADLRLVLTEAGSEVPAPEEVVRHDFSIRVVTKADLAPDALPPDGTLAVSARSGAGISELLAAIGSRVQDLCDVGDAPAITRARHREALADCHDALGRATATMRGDLVLLAEELRLAARALGRITGRVDVEQVLERIFAEFCIGK